ncbi:hypothetical protein [Amycolatopsis sp. NPDC051061]|uniref:hypothetical protein n=1 Tax=Amycolatopsis sp. NPDC051061 TaxID=3155042 RepID=UPI0034257933
MLAILYNEDYKPHDPQLERAWQNLKPDAAFGVANMHRATFDETRRGRPFASRQWTELPDDPDLAIEAEAWYLHDLAAQLPAKHSGQYTTDELLALGYNAGPGNMKAFARGTKPSAQVQTYLVDLRAAWAKAGWRSAPGHGLALSRTAPRLRTRPASRRASCGCTPWGVTGPSTTRSKPSIRAERTAVSSAPGSGINASWSSLTPSSAAAATPRSGMPVTAAHEPA